MRRWVLRIVVLVLVLGLLAVLAVEWVRRGDRPRQWVEQALQAQLGMHVELGPLRATWGGTTRVDSLTMTLPLEDQPFVELTDVRVAHRGLLGLLFTGDPALRAIDVDEAVIDLRGDEHGRWNVEDLPALLSGDGEASAPGRLPAVHVAHAVVRISPHTGAAYDLTPVRVALAPAGVGGWDVHVEAGALGDVTGRVTLAGNRAHRLQVALRVADIPDSLWPGALPQPVDLQGVWSGRIEGGRVVGVLSMSSFTAAGYTAKGAVDVLTVDGAVTAALRSVELATPHEQLARVTLTGGEVRVDAAGARAHGITVAAADTRMQLDAHWSWLDVAGEANVGWNGGITGAALSHEGEATFTLTRPSPDRWHTTIDIEAQAQGDWGVAHLAAQAQGDGPGLDRMDWRITLPHTVMRDEQKRTYVLDDLHAAASVDWPRIELTELRLADGHTLHAGGAIDVSDMTWSADVHAEDFRWASVETLPITLHAAATGTLEHLAVSRLEARYGELALTGSGRYEFDATTPVTADVEATWRTGLTLLSGQGAGLNGDDADDTAHAPWAGLLKWTGRVEGHAWPMDLTVTGRLAGSSLHINDQPLHDLSIAMTGGIKRDRVTFRTTEPFDLLDGVAELLDGSYTPAGQVLDFTLHTEAVALQRVADLVNPELAVRGALDSDVRIRLPQLDRTQLHVSGPWQVAGFAAQPLAFDRIGGTLSTRRKRLVLDAKMIEHGVGRGRGTAEFDLADGRTLRATLTGERWPLRFDALDRDVFVNGRATVTMDVVDGEIIGRLTARTVAPTEADPFIPATIDIDLRDRSVVINQLDAQLFDGEVVGTGVIEYDNWPASRIDLTWTDMDMPPLAAALHLPEALFAGRTSGTLTLGPADEPRPPAPAKFVVTITPADFAARHVPVAAATLTGYVDHRRVLLHESTIAIADGEASMWASVTRRDSGIFANVQIDATDLDMNLLAQALDPTQALVVGRLTGTVRAAMEFGRPETLVGNGRATFRDAELIRTKVVGAVLDRMQLSERAEQATGEGLARFTLEDGGLRIDSFRYTNRGAYVYLDGRIAALAEGAQSPIDIWAVGTYQPLKGSGLPGIEQFDNLLSNIQSSLTTIRAGGTLGEPSVEVASFSQAVGTLRKIFFGNSAAE